MKHCPLSILRLSLSNIWSRCWVVGICQCCSGGGVCVLFHFHTTRQWLVMVEFSLARSWWTEPSVPHRPCMGNLLAATHTYTKTSMVHSDQQQLWGQQVITQVAFVENASISPMRINFLFSQKCAKIILRSKTTSRQFTRKSPNDSGL